MVIVAVVRVSVKVQYSANCVYLKTEMKGFLFCVLGILLIIGKTFILL